MRRLRKLLGNCYYWILNLYLQLLFWYPVWFYLLNRQGRHAYQKERSPLNLVEKRIVRNLRKDGIAIVNILELFPKETWNELVQHAHTLSRRPEIIKLIAAKETEPPSAKSDIIIHLLGGYGGTKPNLDIRDQFIRFATANTILRAVSGYLKILPKFRMFSLHSTILMPPDAPKVFSQNWHRDPDDLKLVKVFLYLSDVTSNKDGPFMYIRGSQFGGWQHIFPQRPTKRPYPPAGAIEPTVAKKDIKICTGRAGTLIFCDTSGFHRGGHSVGSQRRIMFAGTFVTQAGFKIYKRNYKIISPKSHMDVLSKIARYALS